MTNMSMQHNIHLFDSGFVGIFDALHLPPEQFLRNFVLQSIKEEADTQGIAGIVTTKIRVLVTHERLLERLKTAVPTVKDGLET